MGPGSSRQSIGHWALIAYSLALLAFLLLPLVVIVALSFSPLRFFVFPPTGFSLRWYQALTAGPKWRDALANSLIVGIGASALATALGLLAAWGLAEVRSRIASLVTGWL